MNKSPASQDLNKTRNILKESSDKIIQDYSQIESQLGSLSLILPNEYQNPITEIISNLMSMKDYFKNFISLIHTLLSHQLPNEASTSNSENGSNTITPRIKSSYDSIYNEFCKLESITKEMMSHKAKLSQKKEKRILYLEKKLQGYCDEVAKMDFTKLTKEYGQCLNSKDVKKKINNVNDYIKTNEQLLKYNSVDISESEANIININNNDKNKNKIDINDNDDDEYNQGTVITQMKIDSSESNQNSYNNTIVQQLAKMSPNKEEEMIQYLESLLLKSNKEDKNIK